MDFPLQVDNLTKVYGRQLGIDGASFTVRPGRKVAGCTGAHHQPPIQTSGIARQHLPAQRIESRCRCSSATARSALRSTRPQVPRSGASFTDLVTAMLPSMVKLGVKPVWRRFSVR